MTAIIESEDEGRVYGGKSAGERLAQQRQHFLDAGLELIGTVGYRSTTVRSLCREAGLIDRYFYRNFASTEDLLEAVYNRSMDEVESAIMAAVSRVPTEAGIDPIIHAALDAFYAAVEDPRVGRLCWLEVLGVSPRIDKVYSTRIQRFADLLLALATRLLGREWPRNAETGMVAIAAVGGISQTAMQWLLGDYKTSRRIMVAAGSRVIRGLALVLREDGEAPIAVVRPTKRIKPVTRAGRKPSR